MNKGDASLRDLAEASVKSAHGRGVENFRRELFVLPAAFVRSLARARLYFRAAKGRRAGE